ncbi:hypothetical protein DPMN_016635 [Dreissena polymorpha]|uniref:Uncharacterized protein n=1 Tax=Dreissena polymorpha TaxID=45954 RepID=A0A9D4S7D3_DREPO|nr:hypothetical protein DPMN_016635 [Dreissena polymorpha]
MHPKPSVGTRYTVFLFKTAPAAERYTRGAVLLFKLLCLCCIDVGITQRMGLPNTVSLALNWFLVSANWAPVPGMTEHR